MKFAVICSAGGGAFYAAYDLLLKFKKLSSENVIIITDRDCVAEKEADLRSIKRVRIEYISKHQFSEEVALYLHKENISLVYMLYSRLISEEIFQKFPTLNIHPALLPAFKGMDAVGQANMAGVKFLGATLHLTTEKIDDGEIIGQVLNPIASGLTKKELEKVSYIQKTYLLVMSLDLIHQNILKIHSNKLEFTKSPEFTASANPCISSDTLKQAFDEFQLIALRNQ